MRTIDSKPVALKRTMTIILAAIALTGMAAALLNNRKKREEQSASAAVFGRAVTVSTANVEYGFIGHGFSVNGVSQPVRELNFASDVSGRVTGIFVDKGDHVSDGAPLLQVDPELYLADYKAAEAAFEALKKDEARLTRSHEAGGVTDQQLQSVRSQLVAAESRLTASRRKYEDTMVKSPMSGTINLRHVEVGSLLAPNTPLFEIVDESRVKVTCNVPDSRIGLLSIGQKVTATETASPEKLFTGVIRHIGLKADRGLHYPVEVLLDKDPRLRAGMYLRVSFCEGEGHEALLIPRKAVVEDSGLTVSWVIGNGKATRRGLKLGEMKGDRVEVLEGLRAGEEIIVAGIMNVTEGVEVRTANE